MKNNTIHHYISSRIKLQQHSSQNQLRHLIVVQHLELFVFIKIAIIQVINIPFIYQATIPAINLPPSWNNIASSVFNSYPNTTLKIYDGANCTAKSRSISGDNGIPNLDTVPPCLYQVGPNCTSWNDALLPGRESKRISSIKYFIINHTYIII
jgi:hypothetical protein